MEQSQVVCSSPPLCKLEPESPPSWDPPVDFTESNFGEFWVDENWKDYDVGIKNFTSGDVLIDLDMLLKEEPFSWIDERNDGLYTNNFEWTTPSDTKVIIETTSHNEQKPFTDNGLIVETSSPSSIATTSTTTTTNNSSSNSNNVTNNMNSNRVVNNTHRDEGNNDVKQLYHHVQQHHDNNNNNNNSGNHHHLAAAATPDFLSEIEEVLINTTSTALTPPESPRDQTTSLITLLQDIEPCNTPSNNEIDAIVATQAENMVPLHNNNNNNNINNAHNQPLSDPLSPDPWSSPSMGSSSSDSGYDDPDWSPSSPSPIQSSSSSSSVNTSTSSSTRRKRAAATTTEERKMRKKEQNKNAATRYRQKKKQEIEVIIGEERELLEKHEHLKADVTEITREIRYLKSLLRDLYKAKGLIS